MQGNSSINMSQNNSSNKPLLYCSTAKCPTGPAVRRRSMVQEGSLAEANIREIKNLRSFNLAASQKCHGIIPYYTTSKTEFRG